MIFLEWLKILIVFIVMISVLVSAHEYGHYLFARIFKMGIEEFAIGFGRRPLWVWKRRTFRIPLTQDEGRRILNAPAPRAELEPSTLVEDTKKALMAIEGPSEGKTAVVTDDEGMPVALDQQTLYTVRPWPLGGFVRIKGMLPEDDGSETRVPGGFYSKPAWKRFFVLLAGPVFSILAGMVLLFGLYVVWGVDKQSTTVAEVLKTGPAADAGLKSGDVIVSIDGARVDTFYDMVSRVRDRSNQRLLVVYRRGQVMNQVFMVPTLEKEPSPVIGPDLMPTGEMRRQGKLGVALMPVATRISTAEAAVRAASAPQMVVKDLLSLVIGKVKVEDSVGGPIAMVAYTKAATDQGIRQVILLAAMLSISVGFFNLLPIHPLDGGQMGMAALEMLSGGRRLNIRFQSAIAGAGLLVLMLLVCSVVFLDFNRFVRHSQTPSVSSPK